MKRIAFFLFVLGIIGASAIIAATFLIRKDTRGQTYAEVSSIPHHKVGLILGCSKKLPNGRDNLFFRNRIAAAAHLFLAGKVDYLIVSGDNHVQEYDESSDMKDDLVLAGVPSDRIYCDFAGFRTLDSIVRAKEVFGQTELIIISQKFHNQRAIFIARHRGVKAVGYNAEEIDAYDSFGTRCRELLARVKTILDIYLIQTQPKFLGEKISIGARNQSLTTSHNL